MNDLKVRAPEFVAYQVAKEAADKAQTVEAWDIEEKAFATLIAAIRAAAEIALHYRGKATQDQHDSADQNAIDTVNEFGFDVECDAGRLLYYRFYVATLELL